MVVEANGVSCAACYTFVKTKSLEEHLSICTKVTKGLRMEMPHEDEIFKFKDHAATEKTPFISFLDFESFLPQSEIGNILRKHKLAAGYYLILDKDGEIVAVELFFVTDNSRREQQMHDFITSLLKKYRELMIAEAQTWNPTYELTDQDE